MPKCNRRCAAEAKITLAYGPHHYCAEHFTDFFEHPVTKTVRKFKLLKRGEKVGIGVSGGKDSLALAYLLGKYYAKSNELLALMIDEGIEGYRDVALRVAKKYCDEWKIPYQVVKLKDRFGYSTTEVVHKINAQPSLGTSCAFCGSFRRTVMNEWAREQGCDKFATGHNLDDEAQSVLMNVFSNNLPKMAWLGPMTGAEGFDGNGLFVKRVKPLYECPEKEIIAFDAFKGIEHYSEECCPFSWMAKRNHVREMLNHFEDQFPGTKFTVVKWLQDLKPHLEDVKPAGRLQACTACGSPSNSPLCRPCSMVKLLDAVKAAPRKAVAAKGGPTCAETKGLHDREFV
ncbi:MAG TPA: TIGR00269 family protein [Candidatus Diapherotrites archaeon]|uniref:TIGR00269 family protein n=1 Tax=Candidatus Iainarchaeum sp. TaxID=3101447 RepID=A0A7J4JL80_9ARCH|nr:TIGR00269 family protein [Candidatus Diapherotrites archaeon]